jgi:hypothetical protein
MNTYKWLIYMVALIIIAVTFPWSLFAIAIYILMKLRKPQE